jgi:hypothetical protein
MVAGIFNRQAIRIRESRKCAVRWRVQVKQLVTRKSGLGRARFNTQAYWVYKNCNTPTVLGSILPVNRALGSIGMRSGG